MIVNISFLKAKKRLVDNMYLTAEPDYVNTDIEFTKLHQIISSDFIQYSPYSFYAGMKLSCNWNNDKQSLLIFDIDDGMTLAEAKERFKRYTYLITTTKNHLKYKKGSVCDRYRVILPATNIPRGELYFSMLEVMSKVIPMDIQVNTKTGAFLGNKEAINTYNVGEIYDCGYAIEVAEKNMLNSIKKTALKSKISNRGMSSYGLDIKDAKSGLNGEIVTDVLRSLGYDFVHNKFKLRKDERTESCKVYPSGYIIDYGGSFKSDIYELLYQFHHMSLQQAIDYVNKFKD